MNCHLCPVSCGVDRDKTEGRCGVKGLTVAKYYLHPFEEPPVSHKNGSGTIFFGGCSLKCVFCQNYELSRAQRGKSVTPKELTEIFKRLEDMGADNINLVTPDHVAHLIGEALAIYRPAIPVVYNSSGYTLVSTLEEIDKYLDVYLPDVKFFSPALSKRYTGREDYFERASEAVRFMAKKPIVFGPDGKLLSGLLVRHLLLPMCGADCRHILDFLQKTLPSDVPISLMRQYTPMGECANYPELTRRVTAREYRAAVDYALSLGFTNLYTQDKQSADLSFVPEWDY